MLNFDPQCLMATSFKKRGASARPLHPRGSRPSLHNAQLLVSSGVPSMDALLGTSRQPNATLLLVILTCLAVHRWGAGGGHSSPCR